MQPTDKKALDQGLKLLAQFPKGHMAAAGALAVCLTGWALTAPSKPEASIDHAISLDIPAPQTKDSDVTEPTVAVKSDLAPQPASEADTQAPVAAEPAPVAETAPAEPELERQEFTVRSGDSLSSLFHRAGLNDRDVYELTASNDEAKRLTRIMPGHKIVFYTDAEGELEKLSHVTDRLNSLHFVRTEDGYDSQSELLEPTIRTAYREATIDSSLFLAGRAVGLHDALVMELANIFGWDVDFALDIRKGDRFSVLYEEQYLDGEKIGTGNILAAEFTNQGRRFQAVRYTNTEGQSHYYTPEGQSMRKAFLLAPVDFRRISGNFNPKRLHPIFKTVRPHRGTDYAANRGTPVWASGDGRVTASGYSRANGNYVFIQHGNNVVTKYLHLHKRHVKTGERVNQKEVIGTVGATGYATGPHLHYEFLLNGVHRNPRTIVQKLPKAESIPDAEMARFKNQTQTALARLEQNGQRNRLAMGDSPTNVN